MSEQQRPRAVRLALVAAACGVAGGAAALGIAAAAGWLGGGHTVTLSTSSPPAAPAQPVSAAQSTGPGESPDFDPVAIYRDRAAGVVTIDARFPDHAGTQVEAVAQGSGFVVSPEGYVLTSSHVITTAGAEDTRDPDAVEAATEVFIEFAGGDRVRAEIVGWDLFYDIGVIRVDPQEHELVPVPLGDSSVVVVGEPVAAIGSPFGEAGSLTVGVVSAIERSVDSLTSEFDVIDAIQTDTPINRGNSGGPLFNARGEVIGINAQIRSDSGNAEGVGFAIPINVARRSMEQLIETGEAHYAWIGIATQTLTASIAAQVDLGVVSGAAIQCVVPGSPAERAGLRAGDDERTVAGLPFRAGGDVVVAIDGETVETTEDLGRIVAATLMPGETAQFRVVRDGDEVDVPVVLGERPTQASASC